MNFQQASNAVVASRRRLAKCQPGTDLYKEYSAEVRYYEKMRDDLYQEEKQLEFFNLLGEIK